MGGRKRFSKIFGILLVCLILSALVACEPVGTKPPAPSPPPPDEVTPTKPPRELIHIGDFSIALAEVERVEDTAALRFAITKIDDTDSAPRSLQVTLIDDHANEYTSSLNIDLEGKPGILNALPKAFTYVDIVNISMPKVAPIEKVRLGDNEIAFNRVRFGEPSFKQDFRSFIIKAGTSLNVGTYLTFSIAGPSGEVTGWTLPVTVKNAEYNPLYISIEIGTQFVDGHVHWTRLSGKRVAGSGQKTFRPGIKLSRTGDARYGWSSPTMLVIRCSGESAGIVKLMPVTCEDFPPLPERIALQCHIPSSIYVMSSDRSSKTKLTYGRNDRDPAWSWDGKRLALARGDSIYIMNADGSSETKLTYGRYPAWSPDGTKIAFSASGDICVMNADGSGERRLTEGSNPAWSPDGTRIAFNEYYRFGVLDYCYYYRDRYRDHYIEIMNADGSGKRRLTVGQNPAWSPDGRKIAFDRGGTRGGFSDWSSIYLISADGSGERKLTEYGQYPAWSPDGTKIAFCAKGDMYVMNADGSSVTRIAYMPDGVHPTWAPATKLSAGIASDK